MGRKAKPAEPRLTIDEAFQRFRAQIEDEPYVACERLNKALREGLPLWCDGKVVEPGYFAGFFRVMIKPAPRGGWTARMETTATAAMPPADQFEWTVSATDIGRFEKPKSESPRRRPGPVTTHDWIAISAEIAFRCRVKVPKSERKLADDVLQWCEDTYGKSPAESEMREAVKQVCARFRRG
jgi:hypothetical protein